MSLRRSLACPILLLFAACAVAQTPTPLPSRAVGTVKAIQGAAITLTTDNDADVNVTVAEHARLLRMAPGQKDLKDATPIQWTDIQTGDRMLVRGSSSPDGKSFAASSIIVMKKSDIAERQAREAEEWQRRGVGGLVKAVDTAQGMIVLATTGIGGKNITVHVNKDTVIRRYAPDSPRFEDAKISMLTEVKPGDQLRARGTRNEDRTELAAEEIVSGAFRNVAGTITALDAVRGTITVTDLATKRPVVVRITSDSQMRKLPEMAAQMIAFRLRGTPREGTGAEGRVAEGLHRPSESGGATRPPDGPGGSPRSGGGDVQQFLNRMPAVTLPDLKRGDALMIVTTNPPGASEFTVVTLLSGVEPILAAPNAAQAVTILSPWNLATSAAEGTAQ